MTEIVENNIFTDDKLIELIKANFNEDDNKLFELSYKLYTSTKDNPDEFIISLDDVYKWVGFSRKDHAKTLLTKDFKENIHYKISLPFRRERSASSNIHLKKGGENKELILLNIETFKKFCMKANTSQSDKIYDYYIKMEKIIFKYIEKKYKEQSNIIQQKDKQLEENNQLLNENKQLLEIKDKQLEDYNKELEFIKTNFNSNNNLKYEEIEKNEHVYILSTDIPHVYKVGETKKDVKHRMTTLQTGNVKNIKSLHACKTSNKKLLEDIAHYILDYYRCKSNREHFRTDPTYIYNILELSSIFLHTLKSSYENISKKELIDIIIEKINVFDKQNITLVENILETSDPIIENILEITNSTIDKTKVEKTKKIKTDETVMKPIFDPAKDIISWFKENFEFTNNSTDVIKVKYIYDKFSKSPHFINMCRLDKLKYNKTYFVNYIETNKFFNKYYCAKTSTMRTFIKGWKSKFTDNSDNENKLDL
jgi:hypothetical protein